MVEGSSRFTNGLDQVLGSYEKRIARGSAKRSKMGEELSQPSLEKNTQGPLKKFGTEKREYAGIKGEGRPRGKLKRKKREVPSR